MSTWDSLLQHLALYPRWLVAMLAIVAGAVLLWLVAKLLKWTVYLAALAVFGCLVVGAVAWWLT